MGVGKNPEQLERAGDRSTVSNGEAERSRVMPEANRPTDLRTASDMIVALQTARNSYDLRQAIDFLPEGTKVQFFSRRLDTPSPAAGVREGELKTGFGTVLGYTIKNGNVAMVLETRRGNKLEIWLRKSCDYYDVSGIKLEERDKTVVVYASRAGCREKETAWIRKTP